MKIKKINTIEEFHKMVASYMDTRPIYRGVTNSSYELISGIGRCIIQNRAHRNGASEYKYIVDKSKEIASIEDFSKAATPYLNHPPENGWEWLALAQHHGLPTRMLDWTTNPLVAAYFACQDPLLNNDAAIYVIKDKFELPFACPNNSPFDISETIVYTPHHITSRISSQQGLFTVHPEPDVPYDADDLCKCIINSEILASLEVMCGTYGIDHASMFPGLDGVAKKASGLWL